MLTAKKLRRFYPLLSALLGLSLLAGIIIFCKSRHYFLTYQVTDSMPKGFYWIQPTNHLKRSDIVLFNPPPATARFLQQHHWLPNKGWMMKYIKAIPGDKVCSKNQILWINHHAVGSIYLVDTQGEPLPQKTFCQILLPGQYLVLSTRMAHSYDGRYFGPIDQSQVIGVATLLSGS